MINVPRGRGLGLQCPRGSKGRSTGSKAYKVPGGQGVGPQCHRGSKGGLHGPRGSKG